MDSVSKNALHGKVDSVYKSLDENENGCATTDERPYDYVYNMDDFTKRESVVSERNRTDCKRSLRKANGKGGE